jgi:hypothetical protein
MREKLNRRFCGAVEPQSNRSLRILQKATKGTKDLGGNYGSLFPLLPFVKNPGFERLEIAEDKMRAGKHHLRI